MPYADPTIRKQKEKERYDKVRVHGPEHGWLKNMPIEKQAEMRAARKAARAARKHQRYLDESSGVKMRMKLAKRKCKERNPVYHVLYGIRGRSVKKGLEFNLTVDWYLAHFSQGCAVTGKDLMPPRRREKSEANPWDAHVDRIDQKRGYTMDNCRIVCAMFNQARGQWKDSDVMEMADALKENRNALVQ